MMAVLLRRQRRLGGGCVGMMGRIFLATMIMAIFLVVFANFGSGLRHFVPARSGSWSGDLWWRCLLAAAVFFKAIPAGLMRRWRQ